jgi:hypothetical protein
MTLASFLEFIFKLKNKKGGLMNTNPKERSDDNKT